MAKFSGVVGFAMTKETSPGVWTEKIEKRSYKGDVIKNFIRWENGQQLNDNLNLNNSISIIADDFAFQHIGVIRYVKWMGSAWKVTGIDVQRPRLILTIGGVYNEPEEN